MITTIKKRITHKTVWHAFCLLALFMLVSSTLRAQIVNYTYEVKFKVRGEQNKEKEIQHYRVRWTYKSNYSEAQALYDEVQRLKDKNLLTRSWKNLGLKTSSLEGTFDFESINGAGVIIVTGEKQGFQTILIKHNDGAPQYNNNEGVIIRSKKTGNNVHYEIEIPTDVQLDETTALGTFKGGGNKGRVFDFEDGNEYFEYHLEIPATMKECSSRIIIFPEAIDCMTDDVIDYLMPAVYEGGEYHDLQNKRKAFDYTNKDPLGGKRTYIKTNIEFDTIKIFTERNVWKDSLNADGTIYKDELGYTVSVKEIKREYEDSISSRTHTDTIQGYGYIKGIELLPHDNDRNVIAIDTTIVYKKPKKTGKYRGSVNYTTEDYHHQSFSDFYPGTCLRISPYKFLEMTAAAVDMPLTSEFAEVAEEIKNEAKEGIDIQFRHTTADTLKVDWAKIMKVEHDMEVLGSGRGQIISATMTAFASPDGALQTNLNLASRRAKVAMSLLHAPIKIVPDPQVDTWKETARRLRETGHPEEAERIENILTTVSNDQAAFPKIRSISSYVDVIKPVLESQCRIEFRYEYYVEHQMDAQEAVDAYYKDRTRPYSNGDYYNMFSMITDSVELERLTEIAYERIIKSNKKYDSPIAPYVINRYAVLQIRRGLADSTILKPLIYEWKGTLPLNYEKNDPDGILDVILCNRPEILLNQAVIFYQLQEPARAKWIVDRLKNQGYNNPNMNKLNYFINFKDIYRIKEDQRSQRQKDDFAEALNFLENPGPETSAATINNRAVLYTEFEDLHKRADAWKYVHMMDDENPRKWYLMGILWATGSRKEDDYPLSEEDEAVSDEDFVTDDDAPVDEIDVKGIPYYLAYFQKSFDINKDFLRYYFNEGYVEEEMRKRKYHAYKLSRVPAYRKIFKMRQADDAAEKIKYWNEVNPQQEEEDEETSE